MAPAGQSSSWSDVLCCRVCSKLFGANKLPINLSCGHTVCRKCLNELHGSTCPLDQTAICLPLEKLPPNIALLSVLSEFIETKPEFYPEVPKEYEHAESILIELAAYLHPAECILGGSVWSDELSRPMQRKLIALLCCQLMENEGRYRALKTARALVERALTELIIFHQNNTSLSSSLWAAVRARGCQFLGPAMQEEVLKLIFLTLSEGTLMARKTLVMYIVQTLREDYPQVSKTCVGHVVQLLYRASCFNVLKRDGESSLMQLKAQFRDYEALRREHDAQIVQVAFEAGLRISPDQWSALLYGDQQHRSHMQSIIDKLQSLQAFEQQINDLAAAVSQSADRDLLTPTIEHFRRFANFDLLHESPSWSETVTLFNSLLCIIKAYVKFIRRRNTDKFSTVAGNPRLSACQLRDRRYKTRLCRNTEATRVCMQGLRCTYAHTRDRIHPPHSQPVGLMIERTAITFPVSQAAVAAPAPPPSQPLLANAATVVSLPSHRSDSFVKQKKPPFGNLVVPAPAPSAPPPPLPPAPPPPSVPLVPVMIPAPNYPVPVPFVPVAAVVPVPAAVPGPVAPPIGMTPICPVCSPPLQITLSGAGYISAGDCLNDQPCPFQYSLPGDAGESVQIHSGVYRASFGSPVQYPSGCNVAESYASRSNNLDEGQLILRRHEIISRLERLQCSDVAAGDDSIDEDDLQSHVSYTVARSVLYDDKELASTTLLELPPVSLQTATPAEHTLDSLLKVATVSTTIPTVCPPCSRMNSTKPATVQAPCTVMHIRDTISQPLPTPAIQRSHLLLTVEEDPSLVGDQLPPVIRPLPAAPSDPQSVVSDTLDKIVDVRERMSVVDRNGGLGCSVEKQQLKVELNIVSRQIQSLDNRTKQTCLLRELEAVDKKIENLAIISETPGFTNDI